MFDSRYFSVVFTEHYRLMKWRQIPLELSQSEDKIIDDSIGFTNRWFWKKSIN